MQVQVQWRSTRMRHAQWVAHALLSCEPSSSSLLLIVLPPPAATVAWKATAKSGPLSQTIAATC